MLTRIINANTSVTTLARIMGISIFITPYVNHIKIPKTKIAYMGNDRSLVFFVFIVFMACGINATVVHIAAKKPIAVTKLTLPPFL